MLILIVEDDPLIALDLETILLDAGHLVQGPVSSAQRAIRLMERLVAPDLALVDINLIGKGTGIDVARESRAGGRSTRFSSWRRNAKPEPTTMSP